MMLCLLLVGLHFSSAAVQLSSELVHLFLVLFNLLRLVSTCTCIHVDYFGKYSNHTHNIYATKLFHFLICITLESGISVHVTLIDLPDKKVSLAPMQASWPGYEANKQVKQQNLKQGGSAKERCSHSMDLLYIHVHV
jgi:hypothetical protein